MKPLFCVLFAGAGLIGCSGHPAVENEPLTDRYWRVLEIDGQAVVVGNNRPEPHIVLAKDRTAALLGLAVGASELIDLTGVDFVYRGFSGPERVALPRLTAAQAAALHDAGEFPAGSMGPKIEAALDFLRGGGESVLITSMSSLGPALRGEVGTRIVR